MCVPMSWRAVGVVGVLTLVRDGSPPNVLGVRRPRARRACRAPARASLSIPDGFTTRPEKVQRPPVFLTFSWVIISILFVDQVGVVRSMDAAAEGSCASECAPEEVYKKAAENIICSLKIACRSHSDEQAHESIKWQSNLPIKTVSVAGDGFESAT